EPNTVGFIVALDYLPNRDAVRWINEALWPRVVREVPSAHLSIARDVEDAIAFMRAQSVMISPLFAGGGMRIKVLEAMALGKPVVATTIGAGGIDCDDIVIADDAASFAEAVVRLVRDPALAA